jgi:hypothetical protein
MPNFFRLGRSEEVKRRNGEQAPSKEKIAGSGKISQ